jgi:hypothetical protein
MARFERRDFAGAAAWALQGLERVPGDTPLTLLLAACHINAGEPAQGIALLARLLEGASSASAPMRALIYSNLACAHVMAHTDGGGGTGDIELAERLSAEAFALYPCLLETRTTRALALAATGRAADALALLDYVHYDMATPCQASWRETARAFALAGLARRSAALEAAQRAGQLDASVARWAALLAAAGPSAVAASAAGGAAETSPA